MEFNIEVYFENQRDILDEDLSSIEKLKKIRELLISERQEYYKWNKNHESN